MDLKKLPPPARTMNWRLRKKICKALYLPCKKMLHNTNKNFCFLFHKKMLWMPEWKLYQTLVILLNWRLGINEQFVLNRTGRFSSFFYFLSSQFEYLNLLLVACGPVHCTAFNCSDSIFLKSDLIRNCKYNYVQIYL